MWRRLPQRSLRALKSSNGSVPPRKVNGPVKSRPFRRRPFRSRSAGCRFHFLAPSDASLKAANVWGAILHALILATPTSRELSCKRTSSMRRPSTMRISRAPISLRARIIGGGRGVRFTNARLVEANLGADPANQGMVPVRAELPEANFDGADLTGQSYSCRSRFSQF